MASESELYKTCDELVAALNRAKELSDEELQEVTKRAQATMDAWDKEAKDIEDDVNRSYPKKGRGAVAPEETAGPDEAAVEETATPTEVSAAEERQTTAPKNLQIDMKVDRQSHPEKQNKPN